MSGWVKAGQTNHTIFGGVRRGGVAGDEPPLPRGLGWGRLVRLYRTGGDRGSSPTWSNQIEALGMGREARGEKDQEQ